MLIENQKIEVSWNPKNKEHFIKLGYCFSKHNDRFFVRVEDLPTNSNKVVKFVCDYCGEQYNIPYQHYRRAISKYPKIACQHCSGLKIAEITLAKRQEEMYAKVLDFCNTKGYILITKKEELINNQSNVTYVCPIHGEHTTKVTNVLQGKCCYHCSRLIALQKQHSATLEYRQNNLYNRAKIVAEKMGYIIITNVDDITCNTSIIEYLCPKHGLKFMRIANFINGKGCPDCAVEMLRELYKLSKEEVLNRINNCGGKLLNVEDYINSQICNLKFICPECGEIFTSSLAKYLQYGGRLCKKCTKNAESIGEKKIKCFLVNNNIRFEQEKRFNDCKDKKTLPFDFYLPDYNTIIEFDGRQHYEETKYFSSSLEKIQEHDEIKNNYCNMQNINLIRIPYWDINNIDSILNDEFLILHKDIV